MIQMQPMNTGTGEEFQRYLSDKHSSSSFVAEFSIVLRKISAERWFNNQ